MDLWKMQQVVLQIIYMGFPSTCMFMVSWSTTAHSSHIRSCKICIFFDLARFAFNVSPRRVCENSRNIFVRLVLARAVPERIKWILTVLLKEGTLTVGSSVGELMCQRPIIACASWWWLIWFQKTEIFLYIVDRWTDIDIDGQIQI
jgi:hypothetical protein